MNVLCRMNCVEWIGERDLQEALHYYPVPFDIDEVIAALIADLT